MKKKNSVRISKKDLRKLLADNEHMAKQITELQTRMTELMEENRSLKRRLPVPEVNDDDGCVMFPDYETPEPSKPFDPLHDYIDPNMIYLDSANGLRNR